MESWGAYVTPKLQSLKIEAKYIEPPFYEYLTADNEALHFL